MGRGLAEGWGVEGGGEVEGVWVVVSLSVARAMPQRTTIVAMMPITNPAMPCFSPKNLCSSGASLRDRVGYRHSRPTHTKADKEARRAHPVAEFRPRTS